MTLNLQKGKIKQEIENQNFYCYKNISPGKKSLINEIIIKYDTENSILDFFKNTYKYNKENLSLEMSSFLLKRKLHLQRMCDEILNFEKIYEN